MPPLNVQQFFGFRFDDEEQFLCAVPLFALKKPVKHVSTAMGVTRSP